LHGQPMQLFLSISAWRYLLGPVVEEEWVARAFSWGGLLFDLALVPLLLWRPTRALAFAAAVVFHLLNAFMFDIGVFPWLMIGATTVFFAPDWPRRLLGAPANRALGPQPAPVPAWTFGLLLAYAALQVLVPLRVWLYPGNALWTEEGVPFSWRMMLRAKVNALRFVATDPVTGKSAPIDPARWLSPQQVESMGQDPEMMREFAHHVRAVYQERGQDIEVHVLALCSLNGRKPQPLLDPRVDLARQPRRWLHAPFLVPLVEPLRQPPWNVPVADWEKHLSPPPRE
jgi:vitamin K-dependent gamma-carboxylase